MKHLCPWSTCAIDYLGATARMDHACDDIGVGTIEMGNTVAVSMEGASRNSGMRPEPRNS
ncbi:MAG: hypothetical protein ISR61_00810 [Desulfobacteraceae bacterium]|uniref:Uncharacterized protein n=1 Tax=Candidatus Desulfacyla euxinica TaxID=2841693 RepID=A0A8J6N059_9DELT|nr:hypothetical protein [Candidatus Desulfacyla euxinica]MBL6977455.1 hypothetical protein [Desulfobacteraceae bacterium]MBL7218219.1 hypothetical protein [Desulfobacteraceae bacterium]